MIGKLFVLQHFPNIRSIILFGMQHFYYLGKKNRRIFGRLSCERHETWSAFVLSFGLASKDLWKYNQSLLCIYLVFICFYVLPACFLSFSLMKVWFSNILCNVGVKHFQLIRAHTICCMHTIYFLSIIVVEKVACWRIYCWKWTALYDLR